jgi:hypothetical protein
VETEIVGRIENPEDRVREPIVVPVAAYKLDGTEIIERFNFMPVMQAGAVLRAFEAIQPNGVLAAGPIIKFLQKSLVAEDKERFIEFLDRDDVVIEAELISKVYQTVTEVWSARPTRRQSGSSNGGAAAKRTSRAAARSAASTTSKRNRSS